MNKPTTTEQARQTQVLHSIHFSFLVMFELVEYRGCYCYRSRRQVTETASSLASRRPRENQTRKTKETTRAK